MTDPREMIAPPAEEITISRPTIEVPSKPRPIPRAQDVRRVVTRQGLRRADVEKISALLRGGETWEDARTAIPDVSPSLVEQFRPTIEQLAAEPGPATRFPAPVSEAKEEMRLDAWLDSTSIGAPRPPGETAPLKVTSLTRGTYTIRGRRR